MCRSNSGPAADDVLEQDAPSHAGIHPQGVERRLFELRRAADNRFESPMPSCRILRQLSERAVYVTVIRIASRDKADDGPMAKIGPAGTRRLNFALEFHQPIFGLRPRPWRHRPCVSPVARWPDHRRRTLITPRSPRTGFRQGPRTRHRKGAVSHHDRAVALNAGRGQAADALTLATSVFVVRLSRSIPRKTRACDRRTGVRSFNVSGSPSTFRETGNRRTRSSRKRGQKNLTVNWVFQKIEPSA